MNLQMVQLQNEIVVIFFLDRSAVIQIENYFEKRKKWNSVNFLKMLLNSAILNFCIEKPLGDYDYKFLQCMYKSFNF